MVYSLNAPAENICEVMGNMENADLIAAAPDLLEALRQTVDSLDYWFRRYGDPQGCESQMMQNARAAIEAAEGK